jgi:hypothetical protein
MTDYHQSTDRFFPNSTDGFDLTVAGDTLLIDAGILVGSKNGFGVDSSVNDNILTNNGIVVSETDRGVEFDGNNCSITNNLTGSITGGQEGVFLGGASDSILNNGSIVGLTLDGVVFGGAANGCSLVNKGSIYGHAQGVADSTTAGVGAAITNEFRITSDGPAIVAGAGVTTSVSNDKGGLISGGAGTAIDVPGAIALTNLGEIVGNINCRPSVSGNNTVRNEGLIVGSVYLGPGTDVYAGVGNGRVTGVIEGGAGNDRFVADRAKETFYAGTGDDTFVYNSVLFSHPGAKEDAIHRFDQRSVDKIDVRAIDADVTRAGHQHFVFIGTTSFFAYHAAHPNVIGMLRFDAATHTLLGNTDGDLATIEFAIGLPGLGALHASDLIL